MVRHNSESGFLSPGPNTAQALNDNPISNDVAK